MDADLGDAQDRLRTFMTSFSPVDGRGPTNNLRPTTSPCSCSPRRGSSPRRASSPCVSARGSLGSRLNDADRRRGLVAEAREAPLRSQLSDQPKVTSSATLAADALQREHRRRDLQRQKEREKMASSFAEKKMALRMKREATAKAQAAAKQKASVDAMTRARNAAVAEKERTSKQRAAEDADSRARMQRVLEAEEAERNRANAEDYIKRMRDAWKASRAPTDHYAEWREHGESSEEEEEEEEEETEDHEGGLDPTDEERCVAVARAARIAERDGVVQRILALSSNTLHEALGINPGASDAQVEKTVRLMLRLLHPDFSINRESVVEHSSLSLLLASCIIAHKGPHPTIQHLESHLRHTQCQSRVQESSSASKPRTSGSMGCGARGSETILCMCK